MGGFEGFWWDPLIKMYDPRSHAKGEGPGSKTKDFIAISSLPEKFWKLNWKNKGGSQENRCQK